MCLALLITSCKSEKSEDLQQDLAAYCCMPLYVAM